MWAPSAAGRRGSGQRVGSGPCLPPCGDPNATCPCDRASGVWGSVARPPFIVWVAGSTLEHMFERVDDRFTVARDALARAETATGLRSRLDSATVELPAGLGALLPGGLSRGSVLGIRGSTSVTFSVAAAAMGASGWVAVVGMADVGWLAAAEAGGRSRGSVLGIRGSTSVTFSVAAAAMGASGWVAVVGMADVGWLAAAEAGVDLSRVVTIPR